MFNQSMVMVFAHLMLHEPTTVVDFLSQMDMGGQTGLEVLLNVWFEHYESFRGFYSLRVRYMLVCKNLCC
jgi:hypothetical protein